MTPLELRDALANATGPDKILDAELAVLLRIGPRGVAADHWVHRNFPNWLVRPDGRVETQPNGLHWAPPELTASIDAAVTLVPEGCSWKLCFRSHWNCAVHIGDDWATRYPDKHSAHIWKMANRGLYDIREAVEARTVPLALCLARVEYEIAKAVSK